MDPRYETAVVEMLKELVSSTTTIIKSQRKMLEILEARAKAEAEAEAARAQFLAAMMEPPGGGKMDG